jgi:hypothetical protein
MTAEEMSLRSLFSQSRIMAGSKRLRIGQDGKTPPDMVRILVNDPAAMSVALHELTHFHTLTSPLGIVLTARSLLRGHFLTETMDRLQEGGKDVDVAMVKYIHSTFQLERLLAAYEPLLEGIAVFFQTSFPCTNIDDLALPLQTLCEFGAILSMLDPYVQEVEIADLNRLSQGILQSAYDALKKGPSFPFDGSNNDLASELELVPGGGTLPYFLGHAYVRGIQTRLSQVLSEYECPELFFNLLRRLLWAKRTGPKHYDFTSSIWVDMVYGWNHLFRSASNRRIAAIRDLPPDADILEWLLDEDIDEKTTPLSSIEHIVDFLQRRIPEWKAIVESEKDMVEALPNIVRITHMMNLSDRGPCRFVGRVESKDHGTYYVLRVSDRIWWVRMEQETLAMLGIAPSDMPTISEGNDAPIEGIELAISSYITDEEMGLGQSIFRGRPRHFLFWISKVDDSSVGALLIVKPEPAFKRATLNQIQKDEIHNVFSQLRNFHKLLELETRNDSFVDMLTSNLRWEGLRESMQQNQSRQDTALQQIQALWTECILVDLLSKRGQDLKAAIVTNRMRDVLIDVPTVRRILKSAYGCPAYLTGPDTNFIIEQINKRSVNFFGYPLFVTDSEGMVRYMGLWGGALI